MGFKTRIRGVDSYIRDLAKIDYKTYEAARRGTVKAAQHLLDKVVAKIGVYQSTGGMMGGRGAWKKLKYETVQRKVRKYGGGGDRPLRASGTLKRSFSIVEGGKGRLSASVGSSSDYLVHHVYGAPGAGVPMRDPIRVTATEEMDACREIIKDEIMKELGW